MTIQTATVVGFGRFGEVWARLLAERFTVSVIEGDPERLKTAASQGYRVSSAHGGFEFEHALHNDAIFYCVPISKFREIILDHAPVLLKQRPKVVFDCLSVKVHPKQVFLEAKIEGIETGLLHPLFGPDSVKVHGVKGLPIALDRFTLSDAAFTYWTEFFAALGLTVHHLPAEEHDRLAANSQGLAHYIGRILGEMKIQPTIIDTIGAKKLHEIKDQVCNDTEELFYNLQQYNPSTLEMRRALDSAQSKVYAKLLPNRIDRTTLHVGIQGGPGSFNEEAAQYYLERINEKAFKLEYLYTSEAVLRSLHEGRTDRGIFAVHNAQGGIVDESLLAMAKYKFTIIDQFSIIIAHCVLIHPESDPKIIDTIMGHPQAIKQCSQKLKARFPAVTLASGADALADPSRASEELCKGTILRSTAILGSRALAGVFGLKIIAEDLQDLEENYTSFVWVER